MAKQLEVVARVRFCSNGGIEGPIMDFDKRMDEVRKTSGAWSPLVRQSDALAVIAELAQQLASLTHEQAEWLCHECEIIHPPQLIGIFQPCPDCGSTMMPTSFNLRRIAELEQELEGTEQTVIRQGELLTGAVNAIRGEPEENCSHSHHDLPDRAAAVMGLVSIQVAVIAEQKQRITELEAENARLREQLTLIMCEPVNAEYIAQDALDSKRCSLCQESGVVGIHQKCICQYGKDCAGAHHSDQAIDMVDWPADDKRIDAIGQNGNSGEHYGTSAVLAHRT